MLKKYLPSKSTSDIIELVNAAEKEQPNEEQISLAKLFSVVNEFLTKKKKKTIFKDICFYY